MTRAVLLALATLAGACQGPGPGEADLPFPPAPDVFTVEAGPLLERRCGDVTCHGAAARPFAIYAGGRRRLDPADTYLPEPLDPAEVAANYDAALGFLDAERPRDSTLLRKALAAMPHGGGAVFAHRSDPEVRALERGLAP